MTDDPTTRTNRPSASSPTPILAFRDFEMASTWRVRVEPDPLGPVNKIVTLMRGNHRVKSVLARVPVGAEVKLSHDAGSPRISLWSTTWEALGEPFGPHREPTWYVEVDGRRVIEVPERETYPPIAPTPPVPLWQRMRTAVREQARADVDAIAKRLGYHRDEAWGGVWVIGVSASLKSHVRLHGVGRMISKAKYQAADGYGWYIYTPQKDHMWAGDWATAMSVANYYARQAQMEALR